MEFKLPKRKRKLRQGPLTTTTNHGSDEENTKVTSIEDLFTNKKRRLERQKTDHILEQLFENLRKDVDEKERNGEYSATYIEKKKNTEEDELNVYLLDFDDNFMLNCERDSDNEEMQEETQVKETAKLYLDEDAQENLDHAIEDSKKIDTVESADTWHQDFFHIGMRNIRQPSLISRNLSVGQKESHISELSASKKFIIVDHCILITIYFST
jgi:hypothetical protein